MRFNKIRIAAYGPFTGLEMDLPKTDGDFHLIYGPNEAGKSSLLRSLRGLLFGIPGNTKDVFIHSGPQMRIAAELQKEGGTTRLFQRRKGNKNTLLDEKDAAISESELGDFLSGVDAGYFDSLFGLGAEELRLGADTLLRGEGRLGEALFSASLGGTPVDKVIESLEAEAAKLFRGRAGSEIRAARKELDDCLRLSKESVIKAEDWEKIQQSIDRLVESRGKLLDGKTTLTNRRSWLERCRDASPSVGKLRECLRQLAELPVIPDLSESFGTEIREARRCWQAATLQIGSSEQGIDDLRTRVKMITLTPVVLAAQSEIERLHGGLGVYREQKQNLIDKQAEAGLVQLRIDTKCRDLEIVVPIGELDRMRISQVKFVEVEEKATAMNRVADEIDSAERKAGALQNEIQTLKEKQPLADSDDITAIEQAIKKTKALEETAKHLDARAGAAGTLRRDLQSLQRALTGCPTDLDLIPSLDVPMKSTIERFQDDFESLKRRKMDLESRRQDEQTKVDTAQAEIERLTRQRDVPDLDDLNTARTHRDHGWKLVLKDWKGGGAEEDFVAGNPLEKAYPEAVVAADEVADRLRADADMVAQMEEKRTQLVLAGKELERIQQDEVSLADEQQALAQSWAAAWQAAGVVPQTPREMKEWRDKWEDFRRIWNDWSTSTQKLAEERSQVEAAEAVLRQVLQGEHGSLPDLLTEANARVIAHNQAVGANQLLREQISNKERESKAISDSLPDMRSKLNLARTEWLECLKTVSIPENLVADAVIGLLRSRREMFVEYDQWLGLTQTCKDLSVKIESYEADVSRVIAEQKLDSWDTEVDEDTLWRTLEEAKIVQRDHDALCNRIEEAEEELAEASKQADQQREIFDSMLRMASLSDDEALDEFLKHYEGKKSIEERMRTLRDTLAGFARSESVEDFITRVQQENADQLDGELSAIDARFLELDPEIESIRNELQEATNERRAMEAATDESARQTQLAENAMATLQQNAERFARLQMAITLLKSRIDRFREQNQGPFMEKANHWFAEITGGAFSGISTSYDEGDKPVIAGQRPDDSANRIVPVSGMSEGTRDQLYLALRLAGLELHLADHEPMPLILDDLLVHFDDERALRALSALRDFGQRSQVLLFTHHLHLVQLVESQWGKHGFHFHHLSNANGPSKTA